ncbi:MAG: hypothetical protein CMF72_03885 [Mameliella sp.]|nr:hypothetical protein [Mameliella sp.]|tara:strand:- start:3472 stop:4257 length:786 start_codon:yes stop_codon:yes gene_type:complete
MTIPLPSFTLEDRLIVVTGASQGIGAIFAQAFAVAGARVLLAARNTEKLTAVAAAITDEGGTAHTATVDVTNPADLAALAAEAERLARPEDRLVLVNNAGFGFTRPALDVEEDDWDALFGTSARATFFASQKMAPLMLERGYGKIINMSSTWAQSTEAGKVAYSAAKAAVSQVTAGLSTEWAPLGIRVNALAPTATMTEFTSGVMAANPERAKKMVGRIKLGRFAEPRDLVGAALFLASEASDFMTGQTLFVDGGWNAAGC